MYWDGWERTVRTRELLRLHHAYAHKYGVEQQAFDLIGIHCEIVARLAQIIALNSGVQVTDLLIEGALAHDIGTYSVLNPENLVLQTEPIFQHNNYIQHGLRGYEMLLEQGFGEQIAAFARNHTGVGITEEDCKKQKLNLPPDDYVATTVEQEIIMLADKFHTKSLPACFVSGKTARARCEKFGADNVQRWDALIEKYGIPCQEDIERLAREYTMSVI